MEVVEEIVIVGAGLAGLAAAVGLHRLGLRTLVLESSDTLRASGFAIGIWTNAWRVLDALGVGDSLREQHVRLEKVVAVSTPSGSIIAQLALREHGKLVGEHEARCVKRNLLVEALAKELPDGTIRYSSKVVLIEEVGNLKLLHLADGSTLKAKVLIGCDGINSIVAKWLGLKVPTFSGRYAARGFASFPDGHGMKLEFAQYFGKGYRSGCLTTDNNSVYWFFTWTSDEKDKEVSNDAAKLREFVMGMMKSNNVPEEVLKIIENSEQSSVAAAPLRYRSPYNLLWGDVSRGSVCVAGDAFHPMTPDLAQGGCSALEGGIILAKCLAEALRPVGEKLSEEEEYCKIEAALKRYVSARRWRIFELVKAAYVVGFIQEGRFWVTRLVRDQILAGFLTKKLLSEADFDCGKL